MSRARTSAALVAVADALLPAAAQACAACGVGNGRNTLAFFLTTIFLSLFPLGIIAAGLIWLARNGRAFLAEEFRESDEDAPAPPAAPEPTPRA